MPHPTNPTRSLPDPSDFCPSCRRLACHCAPEAEHPPGYWSAYEAGYADCQHDRYDERPMTEWVYTTGCRTVPDAETRSVRYLMTPVRFAELSWRRYRTTEGAYARWFETTYGHDLGAYLAGFDDAGAGLPSAADDPDAHAEAARALDRYGSPDVPEAGDDHPRRRAA